MEAQSNAAVLCASETSSPDSLLLKLPGELRNRIYHFAAEASGRLYETKRGFRHPDVRPRAFYSLPQVCRQIRREYRPIYHSLTRIVVTCDQLYAYLDTFVIRSGYEPRLATGNIVVAEIQQLREISGMFLLDLSPILALLKRFPNLQIRFLNKEPSVRVSPGLLDPMLKSNKYPKLHTYLDEHVSRAMLLNEKDGGYTLILEIKRGSGKPWMHRLTMTNRSSRFSGHLADELALIEWGMSLGLSFERAVEFVEFRLEELWLRPPMIHA